MLNGLDHLWRSNLSTNHAAVGEVKCESLLSIIQHLDEQLSFFLGKSRPYLQLRDPLFSEPRSSLNVREFGDKPLRILARRFVVYVRSLRNLDPVRHATGVIAI